eukprot:TRINITY_DN963_c0_g1_i2.p1 TRINITY_DN963_c0_g1~~TRINITY_DN963_c0_g1_i2.p1  ORF type:complete len:173 (+),score=26.63 TRINITY_DN963_c0_g1_i2:297-815(+)
MTTFQKIRVISLVTIGLGFVASPIIVAFGFHSKSPAAYLVPAALLFTIFVSTAVYTYKRSLTVSYQAAGSVELVLRDFNRRHMASGIVWRLHKRGTYDDDYEYDDETLSTSSQVYSYWIEIELTEPSAADYSPSDTQKERELHSINTPSHIIINTPNEQEEEDNTSSPVLLV